VGEDGNVGIGTANPQAMVHIMSPRHEKLRFQVGDTSGGQRTHINFYNNVGTVIESRITAYAGGGIAFAPSPGANDQITFDNSGNVGIGTRSPGVKLEVKDGGILVNRSENAIVSLQGSRKWNISSGGSAGGQGPSGNLSIYDVTEGVTRFTIDPSGGIGIGTTSPSVLLHLHRGLGDLEAAVQMEDTEPGGRSWKILTTPAGWLSGGLSIYDVSVDQSRIVIDSAGNVGIGTTNPSALLHVRHSSNADFAAFIQNGGGSGKGLRIQSASPGDTAPILQIEDNSGNLRFVAQANGNVGIGTPGPRDRLEVSGGNIRVTGGSFIDDGTTLNVPDYVFDEDYALMSLEELQAYLQEHKHLPNVPSAEDVNHNGLNISQFQMRLLEKVEELTLYTISQDQQIQAQQTRIEKQQAELNALKSKMAQFEAALRKLEGLTASPVYDGK
jgi:hypothetical protein